jgi:3-oxoacyl-[acyl-carrier-protein] synthase-3
MKNPAMKHAGGIPDAVSALDSSVENGPMGLRSEGLSIGPWRSVPRGEPATTAVLDGLGIALPPQIKHNNDFPASLQTSDEWIRTRTGISERRIAAPDVACSDLAVEAARAAIRRSRGGSVRAVVVATTTPDHPMPGVAPIVAERLGLDAAAAFDVQAACSGFVYALAAGAGLIAAGIAERVLVIGADVMSRVCDPGDRSTAVLFGDGAGAVTLRAGRPGELGAIGPFDLGSSGEFASQLRIEAGGSRLPISCDTGRRRFLTMDGGQVFRHAVRRMTESSRRVLARAGLAVDDVDQLVAHQANLRILNAVGDQLGIRPERRVSNVDRCGNTSAASIPIALAHAAPTPGQRILLTAFGAGYVWGSTLLTWPDLNLDVD